MSREIGMKLWFVPQISEHCPKYRPGLILSILTTLRRPGTESALIPKEGIVQAWRTSVEDIKSWIGVFVGITVLLSVSNSRRFSFRAIKESNSKFLKSGYSYDQYHWWPIVFITIGDISLSSDK